MKSTRPKLGAHVRTAGGYEKGIEHALSIGAECIQIFGASPQQWHVKMPSEETCKTFRDALAESKIGPVFLHAAYLVNLASPDGLHFEKSVRSLSEHLTICEKLGAQGLIFHMGSSKDSTKEESIARTVTGIKKVLENVPGHTQLIMENSAGGGQKLGQDPQEIGKIFHAVHSTRVKVCIDTAHAFEGGIIEQFTSAGIKDFVDLWDKSVGIENVVALHVNDSKTAPNSHHDRHENIGEGYIGLSGFKNLAKEKRLHDKAWILEVPGFDGEGPDKKNVDILKELF